METKNIGGKLVVFDLDGVIFKKQFILQIARSTGLVVFIKVACFSVLFDAGRFSARRFIKYVYKEFKGIKLKDMLAVYNTMTIAEHAKETLAALKKRGYEVAIVSSGVPDFLVNDLCSILNADYHSGINIEVKNGRLTGKITGGHAFLYGKAKIIQDILDEKNITWNDTVIIADDRNNLEIMKMARVSIGVHSDHVIRKKAKYLIDSDNLAESLEMIDREDGRLDSSFLSLDLKRRELSSKKHEIVRKFFHSCAAFIPFAPEALFNIIALLIVLTTFIFLFSEFLRTNGISMPVINKITQASIRNEETRAISFAPVTLALGIVTSMLFFQPNVAFTSIWTVAFADSAAALIGKQYGKHKLFYNRKKSIEGSMAFFVVALFCAALHFPWPISLAAAFAACIIESFPIKSMDNLIIPIATGVILTFACV